MSVEPVDVRDVDEEFAFITAAELADLDNLALEYSPQSALIKIGGARSVAVVVDRTYPRLLADRFIAPIFEPYVQADKMSVIMRHQVDMLVTALGGGSRYDTGKLGGIHAPLGITDDVHRRTCLYMLTVVHEVLMAAGFDPQAAMDVEQPAAELLLALQPIIAHGPAGLETVGVPGSGN